MPTYTKNLKLQKPLQEEFYDIEVINANSEKIDSAIGNKVDKVTGKGLSTNDYTTAEKEKLATLQSYDDSGLRLELDKKADKDTVYTKEEMDIHRTYTLTHAKSGKIHTITDLPTGQGMYQCQFIATDDYTEGDTFKGYTAKPTGEETILPDKAFVKGDIVSVLVDTVNKKLGFKIGGSGVNQTLPPQIRSFAVTSGNGQNELIWNVPSRTNDYEGLLIVRKVNSLPLGVKDGTKINLSKTATSYTDTGLTNDTTYYYRAFPYNIKKQYQTDIVGAVVNGTPKAIDPVFANNSWGVIDTVSRSGNIPSTWKVGDTKDVLLLTGEKLTFQIYGFRHDDLADGSGKAGITMGMRHLMDNTKVMNTTDTNVYGFVGSAMYTWLNGEFYYMLPNDLKPYVKSVKKLTSAGNTNSTIFNQNMQLFLFSEIEVWGGTKHSFSGEGSPYNIVSVGGVNNRIKKLGNGAGAIRQWWLRSPYRVNRECFCYIKENGDTDATGANWGAGVCFGFCI